MNGRPHACGMDYLVKNLRYLSSHPELHRGQAAAGESAGVGQPTVSKIITARTKEPGYRTVMGLAKHYGIPIDVLVGRDIEAHGLSGPSHSVGPDDETMAQAVDLLYLLGDARPEDPRFHRLNWAMIKVAAKGIQRSEGDPRKAMAVILEEMSKET